MGPDEGGDDDSGAEGLDLQSHHHHHHGGVAEGLDGLDELHAAGMELQAHHAAQAGIEEEELQVG